MDYKLLKGKNCLITGATGGIGNAIAKKMSEYGVNLFLTSRSKNKLEELTIDISNKTSVNVFYKEGNLESDDDTNNIISTVRSAIGSIDILVNCAGCFIVKPINETTLDDLYKTFNILIKSNYVLLKEFSKDMKNKKWGRIINIGSSSSYSGFRNTSLYCMAKHAVLGFSRALYDEFKDYNIRTYCISPSGSKTDMGKMIPNQDYTTLLEPEEIAEYLIFVISFNREMIIEETRLKRFIIR